MSVSVRVGVKGSLVIKAKLPLLPDGKGRLSEEAAQESGKDKEERRGVTVVDEKGGGEGDGVFNFSLLDGQGGARGWGRGGGTRTRGC